jgi:hypothetical protein
MIFIASNTLTIMRIIVVRKKIKEQSWERKDSIRNM